MSELPVLLALAFHAMVDEIHERLSTEGFTDVRPVHGFAFQFLSHHQEGATAAELAQHLGVTKQAAAQLVDELTTRGYVERRLHPTDRRARMIVLTQRGWRCIERFLFFAGEVRDRWTEIAGADQVRQLESALGAFIRDAARDRSITVRPLW